MIGQICPPKNSLLASHGSDSFARAGAAAVVLRPLPSQAAYRVISSPGCLQAAANASGSWVMAWKVL